LSLHSSELMSKLSHTHCQPWEELCFYLLTVCQFHHPCLCSSLLYQYLSSCIIIWGLLKAEEQLTINCHALGLFRKIQSQIDTTCYGMRILNRCWEIKYGHGSSLLIPSELIKAFSFLRYLNLHLKRFYNLRN
jgi:hypothetical protein